MLPIQLIDNAKDDGPDTKAESFEQALEHLLLQEHPELQESGSIDESGESGDSSAGHSAEQAQSSPAKADEQIQNNSYVAEEHCKAPTSEASKEEPEMVQSPSKHAQSIHDRRKMLKKRMSSPGSVSSFKSRRFDVPVIPAEVNSVPEFGQIACAPEHSFLSPVDPENVDGSTVKTIDQAMSWPTNHSNHVQAFLAKRQDQYMNLDSSDSDDSDDDSSGKCNKSLKRMLNAFNEVPMSTAFSGIDAPSTGVCQQVAELNTRAPDHCKINKPIHLNATEWFAPSQTELISHPCKPFCLFSDITSFLTPCLQGIFSDIVKKGKLMDVFKPLIASGSCMKMWLGCIVSWDEYCNILSNLETLGIGHYQEYNLSTTSVSQTS